MIKLRVCPFCRNYPHLLSLDSFGGAEAEEEGWYVIHDCEYFGHIESRRMPTLQIAAEMWNGVYADV